MLLRGFAQPEPVMLVYGMACLELSLPILDHVVLGSSLLLQSYACFDHVLLVFDSCRFASFPSPRSSA